MAAGIRIDPPPSLACAIGSTPLATSAAAPPEEPPVECSGLQGLRVGGPNSGSVVAVMPSSGVAVLPRLIIPVESSWAASGEVRFAT
jgi:hypothetical protein